MSRKSIMILMAALTITLIGIGGFYALDEDTPEVAAISNDQWLNERGEAVESYWKERIQKIGPEAAWQEFHKLNLNLEELTQHLNAHIFGKTLYETAGEESITVCDFSFGAGCFHEVVSSVIAADGLGAHSQIITKCVSKAKNDIEIGDCFHAYGHGVAYYFSGETVEVPLEAECANYPEDNSLSCASGVLMEYVSPGFLADSEAPKYTSVEEIAVMCEGLRKFFQPKCYPRLIQWWGGQLAQQVPPEEYVPIMENFCQTLADQVNRDSCFESIGLFVIATWVSFESDDIVKYCSLIDEVTDANKCISGAIIRLATLTEDERDVFKDELYRLCALDLTQADKAFCPEAI